VRPLHRHRPAAGIQREGDGEPIRHRLNRDGNRRVNAYVHRIAVTQLRCEPGARTIYDEAPTRPHQEKEAMRIQAAPQRRVFRRMLKDLTTRHADTRDAVPRIA
jgi:hypothetical protein